MNEQTPSPATSRKVLAARRLVLLASAAGLGATVLFAGPHLPLSAQFPIAATSANAQTAMRPASFADVVDKVRPAVFAVRVKVEDQASNTMNFNGNEFQIP